MLFKLVIHFQHSSIHDFGGNGKWHQRFMSMPTQHSVMQKNHVSILIYGNHSYEVALGEFMSTDDDEDVSGNAMPLVT